MVMSPILTCLILLPPGFCWGERNGRQSAVQVEARRNSMTTLRMIGFYAKLVRPGLVLMRRFSFARAPAHGVGLHGVDREGNFLEAMASGTFERPHLEPAFAGRNS